VNQRVIKEEHKQKKSLIVLEGVIKENTSKKRLIVFEEVSKCTIFSIEFSSKKIPKMIGIKMITLSIWTSQHDWIINLDLLF
jgi:hypothetical protein